MIQETINVALAANDAYFPGILVAASSIAMYASRQVALRFCILDSAITPEHHAAFEKALIKFHSDVSVKWIPVNEETFSRFQAWKGNKMAYARLLLPEILKNEDYVVYCDADFLWMRDIAELWAMRKPSIALIGVKDGAGWSMALEKKWFESHGFEFDIDKYFCSGLCFMNLKYFRDAKLSERCFEILSTYSDMNFPDQAALNIATKSISYIAGRQWMQFSYFLTAEEFQKGVVVHYAGAAPWKQETIRRFSRLNWQILPDVVLLWYEVYAKALGTSCFKAICQHLGFRAATQYRLTFKILTIFSAKRLIDIFVWFGFDRTRTKEACIELVRMKLPKAKYE